MATTTNLTSSTQSYGHAFWERLWRTAGIQSTGLIAVSCFLYGRMPGVAASTDALGAFYGGNHTRILIATAFLGLGLLNLLWFAAALRSTLADAGQDGWGSAATASSSAVGSLFLILGAVVAGIAFSSSGSVGGSSTAQLNAFVWTGFVLTSFPRAMLIMSGSLGLWRAGLISNGMFGAGVVCIVLTLLGGTTWLPDGIWSPDGAYSRLICPLIGLVWILVASGVVLKAPPTKVGW